MNLLKKLVLFVSEDRYGHYSHRNVRSGVYWVGVSFFVFSALFSIGWGTAGLLGFLAVMFVIFAVIPVVWWVLAGVFKEIDRHVDALATRLLKGQP